MKKLLESKYLYYCKEDFIENDPISIPYLFRKSQEIEIAAFFSAIFAWGRRDIIIRKATELMHLMDMSPYDFIINSTDNDIARLSHFKHRTFNYEDLMFFIKAFQVHYKSNSSLESAFNPSLFDKEQTIEPHLNYFYDYFLGLAPHYSRTKKHLSSPHKNSACKRLAMFLRWMVRTNGVDFGLWKKIHSSQLIIPLDVHVLKTATFLNLIDIEDKPNWKTAIKLTKKLTEFDPIDPVKYDFALFGMSIDKEDFSSLL